MSRENRGNNGEPGKQNQRDIENKQQEALETLRNIIEREFLNISNFFGMDISSAQRALKNSIETATDDNDIKAAMEIFWNTLNTAIESASNRMKEKVNEIKLSINQNDPLKTKKESAIDLALVRAQNYLLERIQKIKDISTPENFKIKTPEQIRNETTKKLQSFRAELFKSFTDLNSLLSRIDTRRREGASLSEAEKEEFKRQVQDIKEKAEQEKADLEDYLNSVNRIPLTQEQNRLKTFLENKFNNDFINTIRNVENKINNPINDQEKKVEKFNERIDNIYKGLIDIRQEIEKSKENGSINEIKLQELKNKLILIGIKLNNLTDEKNRYINSLLSAGLNLRTELFAELNEKINQSQNLYNECVNELNLNNTQPENLRKKSLEINSQLQKLDTEVIEAFKKKEYGQELSSEEKNDFTVRLDKIEEDVDNFERLINGMTPTTPAENRLRDVLLNNLNRFKAKIEEIKELISIGIRIPDEKELEQEFKTIEQKVIEMEKTVVQNRKEIRRMEKEKWEERKRQEEQYGIFRKTFAHLIGRAMPESKLELTSEEFELINSDFFEHLEKIKKLKEAINNMPERTKKERRLKRRFKRKNKSLYKRMRIAYSRFYSMLPIKERAKIASSNIFTALTFGDYTNTTFDRLFLSAPKRVIMGVAGVAVTIATT